MVLGEAREVQHEQPLAQAALEGEARLGPELQARSGHEQVAQQPELVRFEHDRVAEDGRAPHYSPSPELPFALKNSETGTSPAGRTLAADAMAARTSWSFSRS